jgi:NADP-dependent 3-hydroxy acid dehydrogenase YdfG
MEFENKIVLITGAAGGMGKVAVKDFSKEGAKLGLVDLKQEVLEQTAEELFGKDSSETIL